MIALNIDGKSDGKLTSAFKNLANYHQNIREPRNWDFDGILSSKLENV